MSTHTFYRFAAVLILFALLLAVALFLAAAHVQADEDISAAQVEIQALIVNRWDLQRQNTALKRLAWLQTSADGFCHHDMRAAIEAAWRASSRAVDLDLLLRLALVESRCNPWAVSSKGARGLFQQRPEFAGRWGCSPDDLFIPERAAACAVADLEHRLGVHEDLSDSLVCWVYGHGKWETQVFDRHFARAVMGVR